MAAQLSTRPPVWTKPRVTERDKAVNSYHPDLYVVRNQRESFLHSARLRKNLEDSRKAFLNFVDEEDAEKPKEGPLERKPATKKISFKIKKTSSIYRRKDKGTAISTNTVQELARKYNELVEKSSLNEQPKIAKLVKRVNSQRRTMEDKKTISRKPSVKLKPHLEEKPIFKRVEPIRRKSSAKNSLRPKVSSPPSTPIAEATPIIQKVCGSSVKAAIAIFEQKTVEKPKIVPKPKVPEKTFDIKDIALKNHERRLQIFERKMRTNKTEQADKTDDTDEITLQVLSIPLIPPKKCDSKYETMQLKRISKEVKIEETDSKEEEREEKQIEAVVNNVVEEPIAVIITETISPRIEIIKSKEDDWEYYDFIEPQIKTKEDAASEKIYEELTYEDDGYEICDSENIYETLPNPRTPPPPIPRRQEEPLPPRPPSRNSTVNGSNFYESIYSKKDDDNESTYESIYGGRLEVDWKTKRNSVLSDQKSNSIYGTSITGWADDVFNTYNERTGSDLSGSDRSDDWVDLSDQENDAGNGGFVIVRPKLTKKTSGWSQQLRDQRNKVPTKIAFDQGDTDSDHHYESLYTEQQAPEAQPDDDFDSFDSDSESELGKNDSGVDMGNTQLPEPPNQQPYVFTRLATSAGKQMKRLRRNWSITKNDISKSLSRMTRRKSRTNLDSLDKTKEEKSPRPSKTSPTLPAVISPHLQESKETTYQNMPFNSSQEQIDSSEKTKSMGRKGLLNKFRRSISISGDAPELALNAENKTKSTFYLTETIDLDNKEPKYDDSLVVNSVAKSRPSPPVRPQIPPPPAPTQNSPKTELRKKDKRYASWYSECGLFNGENPQLPRRPSTFWYAEVGLYQSGSSTPSTSSAENSGSTNNVIIKTTNVNTINQDDSDDYYNMKNENDYYNESIKSFDSGDTKKDEAFNSLSGEIQLRLQDEPLYQFYDAAVLESVCQDGTSDFDYDGYEEVGHKKNLEIRLTSRPSAMELVSPSRNNVSVARTLWCEIPEVIQSAVLSTLSIHQKKLQEAKFEMLTSEASYLNSLNVLVDHFVKKLKRCEFLTYEEKNILFDKIKPVKECSEKLLLDLEKCWQDNILLHGICEIIKQHAEENFSVYVSYCENQILLDHALKRLKDRVNFMDFMKQLESSSICQSLTLHSFLMLPMQRITRWPLLVDAILKRLSPQDEEYVSCQYALATLNKIVTQCNEGARKMERVTEMQKLASQLEFGKNVPPITLVTGSRWLVRSGPLIQMQSRGDDVKLTFGKRFSKAPLHMFLFNDILIIAKSKGDDVYVVQQYCYRSFLEVNSETLASLPVKDTQGRHLFFLTILENHEEKTIEMMLSCSSETDKERWLEALSPPKSENPDETLYECWDCPQVTALHGYTANQPDELPLSRGDIINVTRKMADGWYHGERIRDSQIGWFPANYTVEVANPHVRARNLKQRYRLLAFSENYLKSK